MRSGVEELSERKTQGKMDHLGDFACDHSYIYLNNSEKTKKE